MRTFFAMSWGQRLRSNRYLFGTLVLLAVCALLLLYFTVLSAPRPFPDGTYVRVEEGKTLAEAGATLKEKGVIRSTLALRVVARLVGAGGVVAGEYFFERPEGVFSIAGRLSSGNYQIVPIRVTFPEGVTAREMADLLAQKVPDFNGEEFYLLAKDREGYLFPDTYFILPGENPKTVFEILQGNFAMRIAAVAEEIQRFGKPLEDVIVMASLLEREASDTEDRRTIAGILWKRIERGMLLQVDAVFPYIIGKNSFDLTLEDLTVDSPYNTYKYKGLPAGPIANPGIDSILAAVTPVKSTYLYYLSDLQGNFHFSATYEQHLVYKKRYLGT